MSKCTARRCAIVGHPCALVLNNTALGARCTVRPCTHQSHDCLFRCHCSLAMLTHSNGPRTSLATPIWQGFTQGSRSRSVTGLQQQPLWKCTTTAARTLGQPFQDAPPRANRWLSRWIRRCLLVQLHTFVVDTSPSKYNP